jgi:drug/metabolite transporter (DMT)-like permease
MENEVICYVAIGYIGVCVAALAQVLLKVGVKRNSSRHFIWLFINGYTLTGYFMMFCVTLLSLYIFQYLDLKYTLILLPSTYIMVFIFSYLLLREKIRRIKLLQYSIAVFGIVIFNL